MESTTPVLLLIVALPLAGSLITAANRNRWKEGTLARVASTAVALSFAATLVRLGAAGRCWRRAPFSPGHVGACRRF